MSEGHSTTVRLCCRSTMETNHLPHSHLGEPPFNPDSRASLGVSWPSLAPSLALGLAKTASPSFFSPWPETPRPPKKSCACRARAPLFCPDHNGTMELQLRTPRPRTAGGRLGGAVTNKLFFCAVVIVALGRKLNVATKVCGLDS